jgi:tetratricopeptide (TPR) repeat protein
LLLVIVTGLLLGGMTRAGLAQPSPEQQILTQAEQAYAEQRYETAGRLFEIFTTRFPTHRQVDAALLKLAIIRETQGQEEAAISTLRTLLLREWDSPDVRDGAVRLYRLYRTGQQEAEAAALWRQAVERWGDPLLLSRLLDAESTSASSTPAAPLLTGFADMTPYERLRRLAQLEATKPDDFIAYALPLLQTELIQVHTAAEAEWAFTLACRLYRHLLERGRFAEARAVSRRLHQVSAPAMATWRGGEIAAFITAVQTWCPERLDECTALVVDGMQRVASRDEAQVYGRLGPLLITVMIKAGRLRDAQAIYQAFCTVLAAHHEHRLLVENREAYTTGITSGPLDALFLQFRRALAGRNRTRAQHWLDLMVTLAPDHPMTQAALTHFQDACAMEFDPPPALTP